MVFALAGATTSCSDFLDKEVDLTQQADNVFSDYDNTRGFLANIYTYLPDAASKDAMTDNAVSYWDVHYYHQVHNDAFDATNHQFANYYYGLDTKGIRACNQFIKNARTDVIGNAAKGGDDNKLGDRWIAEARAIRALLTFDMACWFGPTHVALSTRWLTGWFQSVMPSRAACLSAMPTRMRTGAASTVPLYSP